MAVLLIENKIWAVKSQFKTEAIKIEWDDKKFDPKNKNYLDFFEELCTNEKEEIIIKITFENEIHKHMLTYPEFKNNKNFKTIKYLK
jgi:hypothetical protein